MTSEEAKNIEEDKKIEVQKAIAKASRNLLFIGLRFVAGLFLTNLVGALIGFLFLKDSDPQMQNRFAFLASFVNSIFMMLYLNRQCKSNNDILKSKIKDILNK